VLKTGNHSSSTLRRLASKKTIDLYFDFRSPHSYLAHSKLGLLSTAILHSIDLAWVFVSPFPIYWTVSTSFKVAVDVTQGHLVPWWDFQPDWKGWRSLGKSPDTIFTNVRDAFILCFDNSIIMSLGGSFVASVIGSLAAYRLSRFPYKFLVWRNMDISFFFLSQLILPPVVLAMPFLVLYSTRHWRSSTRGSASSPSIRSPFLPIVIWIIRDQFDAILFEIEQAAYLDGCSVWARSCG
jgi:multiple sugar transport system permease protein